MLHSDGWVECYGKEVDVRIVCKPHAATAEAGILAEEYLDRILPQRYADLYWPRLLRSATMCKKVTADDLLASEELMACLRELREWRL